MDSYCSPLYFAFFLPVVVLLYAVMPQRHRWKVLLLASWAFFWWISGKLLVYLLLSILAVHYLGLWMGSLLTERDGMVRAAERSERKAIRAAYVGKLRAVLAAGILFHLGLLLVLKYAAFFGSNINTMLSALGLRWSVPELQFALPIGISFYTLQAVSYLIDVYRGTIPPDRNLGRLALYMSFFPALMEGPICRYSDTASQLLEGRPVAWHNLTFGIQRILWGLTKKMVVADRLNPLIKEVFSNYQNHTGAAVALAMVCYTCQLYTEFSGTMDVVIGSAEIFGITLPENFRQPFFSHTISEFWTRWHITLGTWFRDYIFYPVSLSGPMKKLTSSARKKLGNHFGPLIASSFALFCVWFSNGLWHGAGWNYIFFGLYHFGLILCGSLFEPLSRSLAGKLHIDRQGKPWRAWQLARTVVLVNIGELFFRAEGLRAGMRMFRRMVTHFSLAPFLDGRVLQMGVDGKDFVIVGVTMALVLGVSLLHERGISVRAWVAARKTPVRWACYYALILFLIIFGAYGSAYSPVDPIYAGF